MKSRLPIRTAPEQRQRQQAGPHRVQPGDAFQFERGTMTAAPSIWRLLLCLPLTLLVSGCVSVQAPLVKNDAYPADWPDISAAGQECQGLAGTYENAGLIAVGPGSQQRAMLTQILGLSGNAGEVSFSVKTQKLDKYGDAFSTLTVVLDGDANTLHEFPGCFCIKQALACTELRKGGWAIPSLGFGASQSNVYMSTSSDGSLIVRLQDYHIDLVTIVPVFGMSDPWARFGALRR